MKLRRLFGRDDEPRDDPDDGDDGGDGDGDAAAGADEAAHVDTEDEPPVDVAAVDEDETEDEVEGTPVDAVAQLDPDGAVERDAGDEIDVDAVDGDDDATVDPGPSPDDDPEPVDPDDPDGDADDDDEGDDGDQDGDDEGTGQIAFELADWGTRERKLLDEALTAVRVRRAWEAGTLVVASSDADVVDDLIDEIEERIALDLAPGVKPVVYDVGDWPIGLEDRFLEGLIDQRIPHNRGYREIVVGVDDEERVDALIEEVTTAWEDEQPTEEELDGPDAQEVLSELFVSADRLLHDASDRAATVRFDDAATSATTMGLPFGFEDGDWTAITGRVTALRDLLGEADTTDDEIVEAATELRSHLRPLV